MTDGVNRIFGGNSYGVGGYVPQRNNAKEEEVAQQQVVQPEAKPVVDEETVMRFLEANNLRVVPKTTTNVELDAETQERIEGYMARFEEIIALIEKEFGPELAPTVMDLVMDKLMGMV